MGAQYFKWPNGLRLRERFVLQLGGAAALVAIIVGSTLYFHGQYTQTSLQSANLTTTREALLQLPVNRLISTGKRLARSLAKPHVWEDTSLMSDRLAAARDATGLIDIRIFSPDGLPLFVGSRPAEADDQSHPEWCQPSTTPLVWTTHQIGKRIHAAGPIKYRGEHLGTLVFAQSILPVEQEVERLEAQLNALASVRQAESRRIAWFIGSCLVVVALFTGILLARRISTPILDLQSMTARIANGDFQVEPETSRADELGDLARSVSQMASQLDKTTISRQFFSQVIEGMLDGLIVADHAGKILLANGAAGQMIGLPISSLIDSPILSYISRSKSDHSPHAGQSPHLLNCVDGNQIPVLVSASKVWLNKENEDAVVYVFRDITDILEHAQKLESALVEATAANKVRSEFLANMSHELRTPLNAIIGFSEILGSDNATSLEADKRREFANDIADSGKHLLQIINHVLELSRIETGNISVRVDEVDVNHLIRTMESLTRPKAQEKGLEFIVENSVPENSTLHADETKIKKILNALLSNAVKFTPSPGTVTIRVDHDKHSLVFSIEDTGIGMTTEEIDQSFEPFRQADNTHTRLYEGTGLGLTIARQYTELHGGSIDIQSVKGRGTTIVVTLPLQASFEKVKAA